MKKTYIIIIILIILINIIGFFIYAKTVPKRTNKENIVETYRKNENIFNTSVLEIKKLKIERLSIQRDIFIYNIQYIKNEKYMKKNITIFNDIYKKRKYKFFKMMSDYNLYGIDKDEKNNITFYFYAFLDYGQGIVYIDDMEYYKQNNRLSIIEKINNKWYYFEN